MKNIGLIDNIILLIDRHFSYLKDFDIKGVDEQKEYIYEVCELYNFLVNFEPAKDSVAQMLIDFLSKYKIYKDEEQKLYQEMLQLWPRAEKEISRYPKSPKKFLKIVKKEDFFDIVKNNAVENKENLRDLNIPLQKALESIEKNLFFEESPLLKHRIYNEFCEIKDRCYKAIAQYKSLRVHNGAAFVIIENLVNCLGKYTSGLLESIKNQMENELDLNLLRFESGQCEKLKAFLYSHTGLKEQLDDIFIEIIQSNVKRLHKGLIQNIGKSYFYEQMILKYKTRCEVYNKEQVRRVIEEEKNKGKKTKEIEKVLCKDMAAYFFDNGLPVLTEYVKDNFRFDVYSDFNMREIPLLIEAKQYSSDCRKHIIEGIYQLHSYMCSEFGESYSLKEAYYVIYRVDGPIYELPRAINIGRYKIIPKFIDIGLSSKSGRGQKKRPIEITLDEILERIKRGKISKV
ncbi:hypothetical protein [Bacillus toyonensis]|uniref:hypothetical protein n=1 Tax=Bacillus toyonensis TaxID=155322 RepID=UPI000BF0FA54|nr:hypothetical protein [Bacillus toyonensis]PEL52079.1 hypothetical protein CN638_10850 [Bacillus toyonensis]